MSGFWKSEESESFFMVPFPCQAVIDVSIKNLEELVLCSYLGIFTDHVFDKL